jgi:hypothetical protein
MGRCYVAVLGYPPAQSPAQPWSDANSVAGQWCQYTTNNIAKTHVKWGLRIDRACLRQGFQARSDNAVSVFLSVEHAFSTYKERKQ